MQNKSSSRERILIVDDDPMILDLLEKTIGSFGFDCVTANNGREAIDIIMKQAFAIVITDMVMPEVNGMELLAHIRGCCPQISVIVITGHFGSFSYVDVIQKGASDFIQKPFNSDELEAKINRVFRERDMVNKLELLSNSDPLTELFNRRYLDIKLKEEVLRADRQGYPVFLILIDVDNFKKYNDKYGHQKGDQLLIDIADILLNCTRTGVDMVFRHGGDEFALVMPDIEEEKLFQIGERILATIAEKLHGQTGLSLGTAKFIRSDGKIEDDIVSLFHRADQALYEAKGLGRNQLVLSKAP